MNADVNRDSLARAIGATIGATTGKGGAPSLAYFHLETVDGALNVEATDLDIGIRTEAAANIKDPGAALLPARLLADIVAKIPAGTTINMSGDKDIIIKAGRTKFTVRGMDPSEFPGLPVIHEGQTVAIPAAELIAAIRQTSYAAADRSKAVICGVAITLASGRLDATATDGLRLATASRAVASDGAISAIVPRSVVDDLAKHSGGVGDIDVTIGVNSIEFGVPGRVIVCRLIDGHYPAWRRLIPESFSREVTTDRVALMDAIGRACIMSAPGDARVVGASFEADAIHISASGAQSGEAGETIDTAMVGEPIAVNFNAALFSDALRSVTTDRVFIGMNGPLLPMIVRPVDGDNHLCMVMPMNKPADA